MTSASRESAEVQRSFAVDVRIKFFPNLLSEFFRTAHQLTERLLEQAAKNKNREEEPDGPNKVVSVSTGNEFVEIASFSELSKTLPTPWDVEAKPKRWGYHNLKPV